MRLLSSFEITVWWHCWMYREEDAQARMKDPGKERPTGMQNVVETSNTTGDIAIKRLMHLISYSSNRRTLIGRVVAVSIGVVFLSAAGMVHAQQQPKFTLPAPADAADAIRREFYKYDASLPLNAELKELNTTPFGTRFHLTYDSANDQRVTAIFSLPREFKGPHPAILLMHGSGGNKDVDYIQGAGGLLNKLGYATLSIDSQYKGERARPGKSGELQPDSYTTRDAWTQTVIDLRRAVDYLESRPDIDKTKIGYFGVSMGGMLGSVLGGVEPRISCFFLAVPGGGIVNAVKHIERYPNLKSRFAIEITPDVMTRIESIASVIDPVYFVGNILPRPLMITVGIHDELIPAEMSTALIAAAHAQPENIKRVNAGHIPPPSVIAFDVRDFFVKNLGRRIPETAARQ